MLVGLLLIFLFIILGFVVVLVFRQAWRHRNDDYRGPASDYDPDRIRRREMEAYRKGVQDTLKTGGGASTKTDRGLRADGRPRRPLE